MPIKCPQCQVSHAYQPAESNTSTFEDISTRYSHNARILHQAATCPVCLDTVEPPMVVLACGHTICPAYFQCIHGKIGYDAMLFSQETNENNISPEVRARAERRRRREQHFLSSSFLMEAALTETAESNNNEEEQWNEPTVDMPFRVQL